MGQDELSTTVSVSWKKNLGNYESAEVFFSVSGITESTSPEDVDELLDTQGKMAYNKIVQRVRDGVLEVRDTLKRRD